MAPLTSRLIHSSSPRIQRSTPFSILSAWARWCALFVSSIAFSRNLGAGLSGSSWSQRAASGVSVPPLVLLSVREQSRSSTSDSSGQLQNLQRTNATNLSEAPPFLFAFLAVVQLWYSASYLLPFSFCFCTTGSSNLHKIPPSLCLLLVCGCAPLWLCLILCN